MHRQQQAVHACCAADPAYSHDIPLAPPDPRTSLADLEAGLCLGRSYICAALTSPAFTLVPLVAVVWGVSPLSLNPTFAVAFPIYIVSMHAGKAGHSPPLKPPQRAAVQMELCVLVAVMPCLHACCSDVHGDQVENRARMAMRLVMPFQIAA